MTRLEIAVQLLAGMCATPPTNEQDVNYALYLADMIIRKEQELNK